MRRASRISGQWSSLERLRLPGPTETATRLFHRLVHWYGLTSFFDLFISWSSVVICDFNSDLACVPSFAIKVVPEIILATTWYNYLVERHPGFSNQFGLLVIVEYRHL